MENIENSQKTPKSTHKDESESPFSYLLDIYKIKLDTISELLFVDKTLVSKWKHGRRVIGGEYIQRLAEFFYDYDKENELDYLTSILSKAYALYESGSKEAVVTALAEWLKSKTKSSGAIKSADADLTSSYQVFFGRSGLERAIKFLSDAMQKTLTCNYFYCVNANNVEWFTDKNFIKIWTQVLENLFVKKPLEMRMINRMDWRISDVKNIMETMLYWDIAGRVSSAFYTGRTTYYGDSFIILVPGFATLRLAYDTTATDNLYCAMFFDKHMIKRQFDECERLFNEGTKLIKRDVFNKDISMTYSEKALICSNFFPFLPVDAQTLKSQCGLSAQEISDAVEKYPNLLKIPQTARYCLRKNGLLSALNEQEIMHEVLSAIFKKEIVLPRKFLLNAGMNLVKKVKKGESELFILGDKDYFPKLNMVFNEECAFYETYGQTLFFDNTNLLEYTGSFYDSKFDELAFGAKTQQKHLNEFIEILNEFGGNPQ